MLTCSARCFRLWRRVLESCALTSFTVTMAVVLFNAFCDGLICALREPHQAIASLFRRLQGFNEPCTARRRVRIALPWLSIAHDMCALWASVRSAVLANIGLRDP